MIDLDFIERLLKAFDDSSADSLELERGGSRVKLAKTPSVGAAAYQVAAAAPVAPATAPAAPAAPAPEATGSTAEATKPADNLIDVPSPMVGTFYQAPAPDARPYVSVGDHVSEGDTLCIIEAMKLMNELEAEVSGTVREICIENAQPVEFGQVLFRVEPS